MDKAVERGLDWAGLPDIATVARLLSPGAMEARTATPSRGGSRSREWPASRAVDRDTGVHLGRGCRELRAADLRLI